MVADELSGLAANTNIAVESHVHTGTYGCTVDHGDSWFSYKRYIAVQLREPVEEMLANEIGTFGMISVSYKIFTKDRWVIVTAHVSA